MGNRKHTKLIYYFSFHLQGYSTTCFYCLETNSLEELLLWPVVLLSKCVHSYTPTANTGMILASYLSEYRKQGQQV